MFFLDLLIQFGWVLLVGFLPLGIFVYDWYFDSLFGYKLVTGDYFSKPMLTYRIYPPAENTKSMAAMAAFFQNVSANFAKKTPKQMLIDGMWYDNISLEIHSNGGNVEFYLHTKAMVKEIIEVALTNYFPTCVVKECPDPFLSWPDEWRKNGEGSRFQSIFGTDIVLSNHEINPTARWHDFQHNSDAPNYDPISQLISLLETVPPESYAVMQLVLRPWPIREGYQKDWDAAFLKLRQGLANNATVEYDENGRVMALTEQEKSILNAAQTKMNSETFKLKMRYVYMIGKGEIKGVVQGKLFSYLKQFNGPNQLFRPENETRTTIEWGGQNHPMGLIAGANASTFQKKHYWLNEQYYREKRAYVGMLKRGLDAGSACWMIDVDSLTALFHFPITSTQYGAPGVDLTRLATDYGTTENSTPIGLPPANLPV